ncbi:MAG: hypothetical protein RLZZ32_1777 [Cyanobacteriota bacterium]|jgi:hypothetical protein
MTTSQLNIAIELHLLTLLQGLDLPQPTDPALIEEQRWRLEGAKQLIQEAAAIGISTTAAGVPYASLLPR